LSVFVLENSFLPSFYFLKSFGRILIFYRYAKLPRRGDRLFGPATADK